MKLREWLCLNSENVCIEKIYTSVDDTVIFASKKLVFLFGKNSCFIKLKKGKIVNINPGQSNL